MALTKPTAISMNAFDATKNQIFRFFSSGGNQVVKNKITIRDNKTNSIVYQNIVETYDFEQTIPANTLKNGGYYNFYFNTIDIFDNISEDSNSIQFYCLTQATLNFTNIPVDNNIDKSSYTFNIMYNQEQGELLNEVQILLYNSYNVLLKKSKILYSPNTPPVTLQYTFDGLIDGETYRIKAIGTTVNKMKMESNLEYFNVKYKYDELFFFVDSKNDSCNGHIRIESNIVAIDGETNKEPIYIDGKQLLLEDNSYLEWSKGFNFNSDQFTITTWWTPILLGNIAILYGDTENNRIEISLKYYENKDKNLKQHYIEAVGYKNNKKYFIKQSNRLNQINNNTKLVSYFRINKNIIDIKLELCKDYIEVDNFIKWNDTSNTMYNRINDLNWQGMELTNFKLDTEFVDDVIPFNISKIKLMNILIDDIHITKDVTTPYAQEKLPWDSKTVLDCDFDNNIYGGNVNFALDSINAIKIKRRMKNTLDWVTLYVKEIKDFKDFKFFYDDFCIPSGKTFEYAMIPCLDNEELGYFLTESKSKFNGIFVSDKFKTMKLYSGLTYDSDEVNQQIGVLQPYNKKYPKIILNPNIKYRQLSVTGNIININNNIINLNRNLISDLRKEWDEFLTNGLTKVITDWNGNIILGKVTSSINHSYVGNYGMGLPNITFSIVEQGEYDNQKDLYKNGLVEVFE